MRFFEIIRLILFKKSLQKSDYPDINTSHGISHFKKLFPFIKPFWRHGLAAAALLIIASILTLPSPLFTKYIIDDVIIKNNPGLLAILLLILAGLILSGAVVSLFQRYVFFSFEQKIILSIQHRLFHRVLRFPKSFFDNKQTGYLMSRLIGDVFSLRMLFSSSIVEIFTNILKFTGAVIILLFLNWKLTLVSLIILPFFIASVSLFGKKVKLLSHRMMEKSAIVSRYLNESLSGLEIVKAFATEEKESQKIYNSLKESVDASVEQNTISAVSQFIIGFISSVGSLLVLWFGAHQILSGNFTLGSFVAFNGYLSYIYGPARFLTHININLQPSFAALERVFSLFELIPEDDGDENKKKLTKLVGAVSFKNVTFSYNHHQPVLEDISFNIQAGEKIAIVGPTGAGKSTLVNLLIRLYQPKTGKIIFDGKNAEQLNLRSVRERIGIVSQEIFLFDDTIINNIRYGKSEACDEEVFAVSKLAHAHEFITELQDGYQTKVGERGVKLSIGQKQRISIARALLKDPDILIFDEPTSALDALTEKALKETLFEKSNGKTTFIIAHRLSTVTSADKIMVLNKGKIEQMGTHEELIHQQGLYRRMCEEQLLVSG